MRLSYLYDGNSYTSKMAYFYWNVSCCFDTKWWDVFWLEFDYCWKSCWRYGFFSPGLFCVLESMLTDFGCMWCIHFLYFFSVKLFHCHIACRLTLNNMRIWANRPVCNTVDIQVIFIWFQYSQPHMILTHLVLVLFMYYHSWHLIFFQFVRILNSVCRDYDIAKDMLSFFIMYVMYVRIYANRTVLGFVWCRW